MSPHQYQSDFGASMTQYIYTARENVRTGDAGGPECHQTVATAPTETLDEDEGCKEKK
jgi:hypothetical protein